MGQKWGCRVEPSPWIISSSGPSLIFRCRSVRPELSPISPNFKLQLRPQKMADAPPPSPAQILPHDIISDILTRLPPKSILRFKTVSKAWLSSISDPGFVKRHLQKSTENEFYTHQRIIADSDNENLAFIPIKSLYDEIEPSAVEFEELAQAGAEVSCFNSRIVGTCNGLVCIASGNNEVSLWNPAMRKLRKLPNSGIRERLRSIGHRGCIYGFGYDAVNNDYKVVMMVSAVGLGFNFREVEVYSLRDDKWKRIGDFPYGPHHEAGLNVNGALVWPAISTSNAESQSVVCGIPKLNIEWKIVALDLASESYKDLPQPVGARSLRDKLLGLMGGCLCIFAHFRGTRLEVWVMKEFGVQESWIKVANVPYLEKPCWSDEFPFYMPLWCSKDGKMLMMFRSKFLVYNMRDGTFRYPEIQELNLSGQASIYTQSLVSPFAIDNNT